MDLDLDIITMMIAEHKDSKNDVKDNNGASDLNKNDRIFESWQSVLIILFGPIIYLILIWCGNKCLLKLFSYTP